MSAFGYLSKFYGIYKSGDADAFAGSDAEATGSNYTNAQTGTHTTANDYGLFADAMSSSFAGAYSGRWDEADAYADANAYGPAAHTLTETGAVTNGFVSESFAAGAADSGISYGAGVSNAAAAGKFATDVDTNTVVVADFGTAAVKTTGAADAFGFGSTVSVSDAIVSTPHADASGIATSAANGFSASSYTGTEVFATDGVSLSTSFSSASAQTDVHY